MKAFEALLSVQVLALLAGCTGSSSDDTKEDVPVDGDADADTDADADGDTDTDTDTDTDADGDTDTDTDADTDTDTDTDTGETTFENPACADSYGEPVTYYSSTTGGSGALDIYWYSSGYVAVEPGEPCPDAIDVEVLGHTNCCPTPNYLETCSFIRKDENQVSNYYAGWNDASGSGTSGQVFDVCWYEGVWGPAVDPSCCGRPLLCDGEAVVADVMARADWGSGTALPGPADVLRQRAGRYWLRAAQLEHASVASFARFAMELLRFGAPADLVADALQAGQDEVDHAKRCFSLASGFLGQDLGPAPMPVGDAAQLAPSREAFAEALLREGCIGETLAVLDAAARLAVTTEPSVREVLQVILDDEARHAALAWRALEWLLADDEEGTVRRHLEAVLAEAAPSPAPSSSERGLGLVPSADRDEAFRRGWEQVVRPAWESLAA